jgi:twitching motility two-component system response regulator PilH
MPTVLVVDDMQTDRELLGKIVLSAGYDVIYATDGDEAVDKAKQAKPALILLDVVMARLNGFNACRKLKQDPDTVSIPVVLVTSKSTEADIFWGKKQGAADQIAKPFTPDAVLTVMRRHIR